MAGGIARSPYWAYANSFFPFVHLFLFLFPFVNIVQTLLFFLGTPCAGNNAFMW